MDEIEKSEIEDSNERVLEALSIDRLIVSFTDHLESSTKELIFYQKKVELIKQAIQKLKS